MCANDFKVAQNRLYQNSVDFSGYNTFMRFLNKYSHAGYNFPLIFPFFNFGYDDYAIDFDDILTELKKLYGSQDDSGKLIRRPDETPAKIEQNPKVDKTDVGVDVTVQIDDRDNAEAQEIWNSIDPEERKLLEGQDLLAKDKDGKPLYLIAKGDDDKKYHIYKKEYEYGSSYKCVKQVKMGNNYFHPSQEYEKNPETGRDQLVPKHRQVGVQDVTVDVDTDIDHDGKPDTDVDVDVDVQVDSNQLSFYLAEGGNTMSPLVVDFNGDGKVDAQAGIGVDIDGDGKVDGAATNGDKMLAMSDINGNGTIDGTEVFGNKTVNPFTGKPINAKNGFEALKQVALSAEKETGIKCFDGKNVDLNKLKQCLAMKGIKLGFVSDENNTEVEDLSKINKINVVNYLETQETGKVQHNQQGNGTDEYGDDVKVDDVWFQIA